MRGNSEVQGSRNKKSKKQTEEIDRLIKEEENREYFSDRMIEKLILKIPFSGYFETPEEHLVSLLELRKKAERNISIITKRKVFLSLDSYEWTFFEESYKEVQSPKKHVDFFIQVIDEVDNRIKEVFDVLNLREQADFFLREKGEHIRGLKKVCGIKD